MKPRPKLKKIHPPSVRPFTNQTTEHAARRFDPFLRRYLPTYQPQPKETSK